MEYVLTLYRTLADGAERELRYRSLGARYAALKEFVAWAAPRMAEGWEPTEEEPGLRHGMIQGALGRPRLMIELTHQGDGPEPPRWLVKVIGRGWEVEKVHTFADDPAGVEACLRELVSYLLEDEDSLAWRG